MFNKTRRYGYIENVFEENRNRNVKFDKGTLRLLISYPINFTNISEVITILILIMQVYIFMKK